MSTDGTTSEQPGDESQLPIPEVAPLDPAALQAQTQQQIADMLAASNERMEHHRQQLQLNMAKFSEQTQNIYGGLIEQVTHPWLTIVRTAAEINAEFKEEIIEKAQAIIDNHGTLPTDHSAIDDTLNS